MLQHAPYCRELAWSCCLPDGAPSNSSIIAHFNKCCLVAVPWFPLAHCFPYSWDSSYFRLFPINPQANFSPIVKKRLFVVIFYCLVVALSAILAGRHFLNNKKKWQKDIVKKWNKNTELQTEEASAECESLPDWPLAMIAIATNQTIGPCYDCHVCVMRWRFLT